MYKIRILFGALLMMTSVAVFGQGAYNIVISEVLTDNSSSIVDELGERKAWIELENTSYSSYNVRGMYLTTNRSVLNDMKAPARIALMTQIPSGDERTLIGARQHLLLFGNSNPATGKLHLSLSIPVGQPVWIALYNGNGVDLIDSVSVPALGLDESYARKPDGWYVMNSDKVTPGIENFTTNGAPVDHKEKTKIDKFKEEDPHGFSMAIMAMGIVFLCLALLWIFFTIFGKFMKHIETAKKVVKAQPIKPITKTVTKTVEIGKKTANIMQDGLEKKGIDIEVYMAVIGMALKQYEDDVHDVESGVITIKSKDTEWDDEYSQMTHLHNPFLPSTPTAPNIPTTPQMR